MTDDGTVNDERERFWRGLLAGMMLSSAFVGVLVAIWQRVRSREAAPRRTPGEH